jgi:hypothetical protein
LKSSNFPKEHAVSVDTVDWDDDGDLDLLFGARGGKLFLRFNEGSAKQPAFATQNEQARTEKGDVLIPGRDIMIKVADWDGDGLWDIVAGNSTGGVYWLRNEGQKGKPIFDEAKKLVNDSLSNAPFGDETVRPGTRVQVSVGDHNGDGLPDLLMGDYHNQTVKGTEFTPETRARYNELMTEYRKISEELDALPKKKDEGNDETPSDPERAELEARRDKIIKEMSEVRPKSLRHGWVWLFERRK